MINTLDPDQQAKLREMQRSWIHTRDLTCAFWYDYFQGTMANPMIAYCNNRETALARSTSRFLQPTSQTEIARSRHHKDKMSHPMTGSATKQSILLFRGGVR